MDNEEDIFKLIPVGTLPKNHRRAPKCYLATCIGLTGNFSEVSIISERL